MQCFSNCEQSYRLLCRDEVTLIEQRTAFVQQLRHALAEYYPAALEAFEDWTRASAGYFYSAFQLQVCWPKPAGAAMRYRNITEDRAVI